MQGLTSMLAGFPDVSDNMLSSFMKKDDVFPNAREMEDKMRAITENHKSELKEVRVVTYDLSKPEDVQQYSLDIEHIFLGMFVSTHMLLVRERQFVSGDNPRWLVHMEWIEFKINDPTKVES